MSTGNPFDILCKDDDDNPSRIIAIQEQKAAAKKSVAPATAAPASAKFPSKPAPPSQAVKEARGSTAPPSRGGAGGAFRGGSGRGRGGGFRQERYPAANGDANGPAGGNGVDGAGVEELVSGNPSERGRGGSGAPRGSFRGGRRGGYQNVVAEGDSERPPRRMYERHSGTGRGYEMKREGSGRGNWGTTKDDVLAQATEDNTNVDAAAVIAEKPPAEHEDGHSSEETKDKKEGATDELAEKEPEDKEMTLEEYEKVREEKRRALLAMKNEERKVEFDKEFESMQQLSVKKGNDEVFVKLGADKDSGKKSISEREERAKKSMNITEFLKPDKDSGKKSISEREERAKKSMNITEFLKPAKGERYYGPGSRGRGRGGQGDRGSFRGLSHAPINAAPAIQDPQHFPTLSVK